MASGVCELSGLEVLGGFLVADQVVVEVSEGTLGDSGEGALQQLPDGTPDAADGVVEQGPDHGPGPPDHPHGYAPLVVTRGGDDGCAHLRAVELGSEPSLHLVGEAQGQEVFAYVWASISEGGEVAKGFHIDSVAGGNFFDVFSDPIVDHTCRIVIIRERT